MHSVSFQLGKEVIKEGLYYVPSSVFLFFPDQFSHVAGILADSLCTNREWEGRKT